MKRLLYTLTQIIWGFPQTALGLAVLAAHARKPHFAYHGAIVTIWKTNAGLSLGPFIFIDERHDLKEHLEKLHVQAQDLPPAQRVNEKLLVHEYGHTVQSLILGPLYLVVIGLPSVIWMKTPRLSRRRSAQRISYYSFYTERWANYLGERVLKRHSMGQSVID